MVIYQETLYHVRRYNSRRHKSCRLACVRRRSFAYANPLRYRQREGAPQVRVIDALALLNRAGQLLEVRPCVVDAIVWLYQELNCCRAVKLRPIAEKPLAEH